MPISAGGSTGEALPLGHEIIAVLEADAVHIVHDERFLYAACRDLKVRVWSKEDWQLVAELGETSSEPLVVHVDDEQVYATCERRVYVWKKETWGMTGWFELTYQAITSTLQGDSFYVGARDGRLVSIKKHTHETSGKKSRELGYISPTQHPPSLQGWTRRYAPPSSSAILIL
ncbi:MAG: hypothetical protein ACXAAR_05710 [Candidatus Thorarchaeota archaeon]